MNNTVVNKDIRWGFLGIQINESWVDMMAREMYSDDEEYDFDKDDVDSEKVRILLTEYTTMLEKYFNKGWFYKMDELTRDMVSEYSQEFIVEVDKCSGCDCVIDKEEDYQKCSDCDEYVCSGNGCDDNVYFCSGCGDECCDSCREFTKNDDDEYTCEKCLT